MHKDKTRRGLALRIRLALGAVLGLGVGVLVYIRPTIPARWATSAPRRDAGHMPRPTPLRWSNYPHPLGAWTWRPTSGRFASTSLPPPAVRRKTEERPDLTGCREVPDPVGARQTESESH
jgi:hypothetical protein